MKDSFTRQIDYLRLSITDLCNLRCRYCMPEGGISKISHERIFRIEELTAIAEAAVALGIKKIRLTGGEPLVRRGLLELVRNISSIDGLETLSLTTNGILLDEMAPKLKEAGVDRVNISLDTLNPNKYRWITRFDRFDAVMNGIRASIDAGLTPLKVNTVLVGGFNDDEIPDFRDFAAEHDIEVRFIELMPIGMTSGWTEGRYISNQAVLDAVPGIRRLEITEHGSPAEVWALPGGRGRFGLINPISHKFCGNCNRLRISAEGKLMPCLHSSVGIDIREELADGKSLEEIISEGARMKPKEHNLDGVEYTAAENNMHQVGG